MRAGLTLLTWTAALGGVVMLVVFFIAVIAGIFLGLTGGVHA